MGFKENAYLLIRVARYDEAEQMLEEALSIFEEKEMALNMSPRSADWQDAADSI